MSRYLAPLAPVAALAPPVYATAIERLAELGVLPRPFAANFRAVAGFRNVLVHRYLDVDPHVVHRLLNERLEDFPEFARLEAAYVESQTEG